MNHTLKSIGAILAGLIAIFTLSILSDQLLEKNGWMKIPFDDNPFSLQLLVTFYRIIYNIAGSYITAALAPGRPMRHAMILGYIGLALSILGAIAMWDKGPAWYNLSFIFMALPCAWLGGKLKTGFRKI